MVKEIATPESYPLLDEMREKRVFDIERKDDDFLVMEACDEYFAVRLTKAQLLRLAAEIADFADQ